MIKRLMAIVIAIGSATNAGAQAGTESYIYLTNPTLENVLVHIGVRNTTGYDPFVSSIIGMRINATSGLAPSGGCSVQYCSFGFLGQTTVGPVDTDPFPLVAFNGTTQDSFYGGLGLGAITDGWFSVDLNSIGVPWGIIGCTRPTHAPTLQFGFSGRNCLPEGFDGFTEFTFSFMPDAYVPNPALRHDARTYGVNDFSVFFDVRTTALITPEPSTWALMAAGLLALGFVSRRRRPRSPS